MKTRHRIACIAVAALTVLALSGCRQVIGPEESPEWEAVTEEQTGGVSLRLTFPDYSRQAPYDTAAEAFRWEGTSASRAIAPQTARIALSAEDAGGTVTVVEVDLASNGTSPVTVGGVEKPIAYSWSGSIDGIPVGTYPAGRLTVSLRDSAGITLTEGSNASEVVIDATTPASFSVFTVPVGAPTLTDGFASAPSLADGEMVFYEAAFALDHNYAFDFDAHVANPPDLVIFNENGEPTAYETITSSPYESRTNTLTNGAGTYYYGVLADEGAVTPSIRFHEYGTSDAGGIRLEVDYAAEPTWAMYAYAFTADELVTGGPVFTADELSRDAAGRSIEYLDDDVQGGSATVSYPGGSALELIIFADDPALPDPASGPQIATGEPAAYGTTLIAGDQHLSASPDAFDTYLRDDNVAFEGSIAAGETDTFISLIENDQRLRFQDRTDQAGSVYTADVKVSVRREDGTSVAEDVSSGYTTPIEFDTLSDDGAHVVYIYVAPQGEGEAGTYSIQLENLGTIAGQPVDGGDAGGSDSLTFESTDVGFALADPGEVESTLVVGGVGAVEGLTAEVSITHTWDNDLTISLTSPSGTTAELSSWNGGDGDNYTSTVFDDGAATSVTDGVAPFTGTYRPEQPLSIFTGECADGTWTLSVEDDTGSDTGTLDAFILTFALGDSDATPSPFGEYLFSGSATDSAGTADGTIHGAPVPVADRSGTANTAYGFDGDDYIELPAPASLQSFSVSVWVQTFITGPLVDDSDAAWYDGWGIVDAERTAQAGDWGLALLGSHAGFGVDVFQTNYAGTSVESTVAVNDGAWHHLVATCDVDTTAGTTTLALYVDAVLQDSITIDTIMSFDGLPIGIGNNPSDAADGLEFFDGTIDDVRLFDAAIDQARVDALYAE